MKFGHFLSQPKLLAGGAAAALVVGLGFGWLARAPIDAAVARAPAVAPNLTVETPGEAAARQAALGAPAAPAVGPPPAPISAAVYSPAEAIDAAPRRRVARQDSIPAFGDQQPPVYDETQAPRDGAEDRDPGPPLGYPPPPPPYGFGYGYDGPPEP
jgi:hypothetical protein